MSVVSPARNKALSSGVNAFPNPVFICPASSAAANPATVTRTGVPAPNVTKANPAAVDTAKIFTFSFNCSVVAKDANNNPPKPTVFPRMPRPNSSVFPAKSPSVMNLFLCSILNSSCCILS